MPIEWAMISGAVTAFAHKYLEHRLSDFADGHLKLPGQSEILKRANQAFIDRFSKELDSLIDLPTITEEAYRAALQTFLLNPAVQDKLADTLDGWSDLDWVSLKASWDTMFDLEGNPPITLPADFDWPKLATTYHDTLRRYLLADRDGREILATSAAVRGSQLTEQIKTKLDHLGSLTRPFDLDRYRRILETAYSRLRVGALDEDGAYIDKRVRLAKIYTARSVKSSIPPRDITRDYLRQLRELAFNTRALLEADDGRLTRESRRTLERAEEKLVSFRLTMAKELEERLNRYKQQPAIPVDELTESDQHKRVVLAGDPGLGKSTLLRALALRWVEDQSRLLPLLIELRYSFGSKEHESFLEYLEHGSSAQCGLPALELHEYLSNNSALVMFDGLDEVPSEQRQHAVSSIIRFRHDYPEARIIVTTRLYGYYPGSTHPEQFQDADFEQYTLQDLNDQNIVSFIEAWHKEAFSEEDNQSRFADRLLAGVRSSPAIHELAANPLLLTMMAVLNRYQELPRDRVVLYEKCAGLLLAGWDSDKFPELGKRNKTLEQKFRILEEVAAAMQDEHRGLAPNLIAEDRLRKTLEQELARLSISQPQSIADDMIVMLRERNFMLAYVGDKQYSFVHRTFLEYFFARKIRYRFEITRELAEAELLSIFLDHGSQDEWHEILLLTCSLIETDSGAMLLSALLDQAKAGDRFRFIFLAAECLRGVGDAESVAIVRSAVREKLLYIKEVFWGNTFGLGSPELEFDYNVRGRALRELALGWSDDPSILALLKQRAEDEVSEHVRATALSAVASGWSGRSDIIDWLIKRAEVDLNAQVRLKAVLHVASVAGKDRRIAEWIQLRFQDDPDQEVRRAAMSELVRVWSDDPWFIAWLETVARDHFNVRARYMASLELRRVRKPDKSA